MLADEFSNILRSSRFFIRTIPNDFDGNENWGWLYETFQLFLQTIVVPIKCIPKEDMVDKINPNKIPYNVCQNEVLIPTRCNYNKIRCN